METRTLSGREEARLKAMNRQLYPGRLRVIYKGAFQFDYRKKGKAYRRVVGHEIEESYERALVIRRELDNLPVISQRKLTLEQWHEIWLIKKSPAFSPATVEGYRYCWQAIPATLKALPLDKLTEEKIAAAVSTIESPSMRSHSGAFLSNLLNAAVTADHLVKSPWKCSDKRKKKVVAVLKADELLRVFSLATDTARPALALAGFCGLRREEIMALRVQDIDLQGHLLYVLRARVKIYGNEGFERIKATKTEQPRVIPIPEIAIPILRTSVEGKQREDLLYPVYRNDLPSRLRAACRRANVPELTLHELRHVCGSNLMMTGGLPLAQAVLGHKDITTTVDTYGHLSAVYLMSQVERANLSDERVLALASKAGGLLDHSETDVREFAVEILAFCQKMSK